MKYLSNFSLLALIFVKTVISGETDQITLAWLYSSISDQHELVESSNYEIESAQKKSLYADSKPNPRLEIGYWLEPIQTKGGPTRNKFVISQKIPPKSQRKLKKGLELGQLRITELYKERVIQNLKFEITKYFFNYHFLYEKRKILSDNLKIVESWSKIWKTHYSHHDFRYPQLVQLQIDATKIQDQIREINESIPNIYRDLVTLAQIDSLDPLRPYFSKVVEKPTLIDDVENNIDLLIMESKLTKQKIRKNFEKTFQIPSKTLKTEWTNLQRDQSFQANNPWMVGIGFDFILNKKQINSNVEAEDRRIKVLEKKLSYFRKDLKSKIKTSNFNLQNDHKKYLLYRNDLLPRTQELLESLQINYSSRANDMDFFALLETLRSLLKMELDIAKIQKSYFHELANYQRLSGKLLF